jgi:hypothetical protein
MDVGKNEARVIAVHLDLVLRGVEVVVAARDNRPILASTLRTTTIIMEEVVEEEVFLYPALRHFLTTPMEMTCLRLMEAVLVVVSILMGLSILGVEDITAMICALRQIQTLLRRRGTSRLHIETYSPLQSIR